MYIFVFNSTNLYVITEQVREDLSLHCFQIDINSDLEPQGPFNVFIYKMTDKLAHAESGDQNV